MSGGAARRPIIAANWKMHMTHTEAIQFAQKLHYVLEPPTYERVEIVVCAPFTDLRTLQTLFDADRMHFALGAQDVYWEATGAFTGEISPLMLQALHVSHVICGHSERRELFGEPDEWVRRKLEAVYVHGMTPILCVGETEQERDEGEAHAKVARQLEAGTAGLTPEQASGLVVAYEPIWAIGTGKHVSTDDAQEMCALVRSTLAAKFGSEIADRIRVQYGGSVKSGNIETFMTCADIDGALVGGASLDPEEFGRILTVW